MTTINVCIYGTFRGGGGGKDKPGMKYAVSGKYFYFYYALFNSNVENDKKNT